MTQPAAETDRRRVAAVLIALNLAFAGGVLYPWLADLGPILSLVSLLAFGALLRFSVRAADFSRTVSLRSALFLKAWLSLTIFVMLIGGFEYATQVAMRLGWIEPYRAMETMVRAGTEDYRAAHITADRRREPDPLLWWRPRNEPPYNAQRMKGPLATLPKPAGTFRILCYGDSNTDGTSAGSWPEELQQLFAGPGPPTIEVLNAGVAGFSSHQGLLRFLEDVDRYQPDLVLVSFGWNDATPVAVAPDHEYTPPSRWWVAIQRVLIRFDFYRTLLHLPQLRSVPLSDDEYRGPRVPLDRYLRNMASFASTADAAGAQTVYLTRPFRESAARPHPPPWIERVDRYNRALVAFGADRGTPVVSVAEHFEGGRDELFADASHFSRQGQRAMAAFVRDQLDGLVLLD